jgi:hypothetical protein
MAKEEMKLLYRELQGYLAQAPELGDPLGAVSLEESVWNHYNEAVNLLNAISGKDYSRFLIRPETDINKQFRSARLSTYRQRLGGLISRLRAEYFADEPNPLEVAPQTMISQTQQLTQSVHIQMLLDIQSKIDSKISSYKEGSREKGFLQKLKGSLSSLRDVTQLLTQIVMIANEFGLNVNDILNLFT